ncbi:MAG: hypothetical protein GC202_01525 [Alphaproteobacteria bacterium]|nr:hypothetical protein [Alphaproteobacteria bacterium]
MKKRIAIFALATFALASPAAYAQTTHERANTAGEVRGKDRASQVKEQNEKKKAEKSQAGEKKKKN